jgi:hypothetical protein
MRTLALLVIVGLTLPSIGHAEERGARITHGLIGAYIAGAGADLSTTQRCLGAGTCHELNPALKPLENKPVLFGTVKMAVAAAIAAVLIKNHEQHPKVVRWIAGTLAASSVYIAVRNTRTARR